MRRRVGKSQRASAFWGYPLSGISFLTSQPTHNVHLTTSASNASTQFSVLGASSDHCRSQFCLSRESQSPKLPLFQPMPPTLFVPLPPAVLPKDWTLVGTVPNHLDP
jgi:hypothetical protein